MSSYDWETLFAGYQWNAETTLYGVRYRDMASWLGRWQQRDRIAAVEANVYSYVSNSPVNFIDPSGLRQCTLTETLTACLEKKVVDADVIVLNSKRKRIKVRKAVAAIVKFEAKANVDCVKGDDPACCEFELWAKGEFAFKVKIGMKEARSVVPHVLPGSGAKLDKVKLQQDSPTIPFTGPAFTARDAPGFTVTDRAKWAKLKAIHAKGGATIEWDILLGFEARVNDNCNAGKNVATVPFSLTMSGPIDKPTIKPTKLPAC